MHIGLPAPAEAPAGQHGFDLDALERQPQDRGDHVVVAGLQLASEAGPRTFPIPVQKSIKRLHWRVGKIRKGELCLDDLFGFREHGLGVATLRHCDSGNAGKRPVLLDHLLAASLLGRRIVPGYVESFTGFQRGPHALRIDRDSGRQLLDVDHARNRPRGRRVEARNLAAEARWAGNDNRQHSRRIIVDSKVRFAIRLFRHVELFDRALAADEPERTGLLERRVLGHGQRCGSFGELTETPFVPCCWMAQHAALDEDFRRRHVPQIGRGLH